MLKNIITAACLFIILTASAQDDIPVSQWITSPVKVDGKPEEWHLPLRFFDSNSKLFYAFANDKKNLYICFQAEGVNQQKIMQAGMKVSLASKTGDKRKVSLSFPLPQTYEAIKPMAGEDSAARLSRRKDMKNSFLLQHTLMEVSGFATRNGTIAINDSSGINAAINWDDNNRLTYEIAIPLSEFLGAGYATEDLSKYITMEVQVNPLKNSGGGGGNGGGYGGRGGGGRMGMGGGGRMGGGGGRRGAGNMEGEQQGSSEPFSDRAALFQKSGLKQKFILGTAK